MQPLALKIVVIDDDQGFLFMVEHWLHLKGYRNIKCFANPFDALSYIARCQVDLLITDYQMPGLNGLQLLDLTTHIPYRVFVSVALAFDPDLQNQAQAKGAIVLSKPLCLGHLAEVLASLTQPATPPKTVSTL